MFFRYFKQTTALILAIALVLPSVALFHPQKAKADTVSCATRAAAVLTPLVGSSLAQTLVVPTGDVPNKPLFTTSAQSDFGQFFAECILKPIAIRLANAMIHNMTSSIVNWINSGFKGNPSFVVDLKGFLNDSIDEAIGEFISKDLGAGFLCSPFAFQVRIAVAQTYMPYRARAACTLTDISRNVSGFIDSNNSGGWDYWLEVTTVPQNNVYGATILAQNELTRKILEKIGLEEKKLDWGRGFRGKEVCYEDPFSLEEVCETVTTGAVVQQMLSDALGSDLRQLELADDLDAIIAALMNQLTYQVMNGARGLLGAGRRSDGSYGSRNYVDAVRQQNVYPNLSEAIEMGVEDLSSDANLDELFTGEGIGLSTTTINVATSTPGVEEAFTPRFTVASSTSSVSSSTPLFYDLRIFANKASTTITVATYITSQQTTLAPPFNQIPFSNLFSDLTISVGQVRGVITSHRPGSQTAAVFSNALISDTEGYRVRYVGTKKTGAPLGVYKIETVVSSANEILGRWSNNLVIE